MRDIRPGVIEGAALAESEVLEVAGIKINEGGKGLMVEKTLECG